MNKLETKLLPTPLQVLNQTFGFNDFRGKQEEIIDSILKGQDTLVLIPTGAGKSICYQIPSLCLPGITVVISPLISLMQNQVMALKQLGIKAEFINSSLSQDEYFEIKKNIKEIKLLYISPERFQVESFQEWLKTLDISFFAIDEAHCVSRWGHDFRPDYIKLSNIKEKFNKPIIALTATADLKTREDIPKQLQMKNYQTFLASFDRPNIKLLVQEKQNNKEQLLDFLKDFKGQSGIVYCLSRNKVDETTLFLQKNGYNAISYHAGMSSSDRSNNQKEFILKEGVITVATIAFGMGIDKPDVRFVVHLDMPQNLEAYYQEIGRCGRDGENSVALLFYSLQDYALRSQMIHQNESSQKMSDFGKLNEMLAFAETLSCKRNYLMRYFGSDEVSCNNCESCLNQEEKIETTSLAHDILKIIKATKQYYGMSYIVLILKGSNAKNIKEEHKLLPEYGSCKLSESLIKKTIRQMIVSQSIKIDLESGFNNLLLLNGVHEPIFVKKDSGKVAVSKNEDYDLDSDVFSKLKELRTKLAHQEGIPPYLVLHDKSLHEMAKNLPSTLKELGKIHGWGEKKIQKYGQKFLELLKSDK